MKTNIEKLNKIADWILTLPKEEQFKISPLDFFKLANMLEKYHSQQSSIFGVVQAKPEVCEHPFEAVMSKCNGELNHCLKCGKHL